MQTGLLLLLISFLCLAKAQLAMAAPILQAVSAPKAKKSMPAKQKTKAAKPGKRASKPAPKPPDLIEGCQGEGCGCSHESKTDKPLTLYKEMSTRSKLLGKFSTGTEATLGRVMSLVVRPGKARVTKVMLEESGLKPDDILTHIFSQGEGFIDARLDGKQIGFQEGDLEYLVLEEPRYEVWTEVTVDKLHGYTDVFPFAGCLD